jgi:hypothetical protein
MRRYLLIVVLLTLAVCIVAGAAYADIPDRIRDQQARINQGIRSGALTRSEADVLQDNLSWIRETFSRMKTDGSLTPAERARLDQMLERNSQMIYNKKHNPIGRVYVAEQRAVVGDFQERIRDQRERIEQGIRSGELTRSEADILLDNLDRIRDRFSRMKADGRFTLEEQARVDRLLDENDRMIRNKKHNAARRLDW